MKKEFKKGLVALSADPVTFGHIALIRKALTFCDELVVLVANNDAKRASYVWNLAERTAMVERAVSETGFSSVCVMGFAGLLTDAYLREGCDAIFRGVRNDTDRRYEEEQFALHAMILPEVATRVRYLVADEAHRYISSTAAKAFTAHGVDTSKLVPAFVKAELEERIAHQWKIGITGEIGVGKSYVAHALVERFSTITGIAAHHINLDEIIRELYIEDSPGAQLVRDELATLLGNDVLATDRRSVERTRLAERMFAKECLNATRERVHAMTAPHVERKYRDALFGKRGLIVVEWAQLAEMAMGHWVNHTTIVVESPDRATFLAARNISPAQMETMRAYQWTGARKVAALVARANEANHGTVLRYENRVNGATGIDNLVASVVRAFPTLPLEASPCKSVPTKLFGKSLKEVSAARSLVVT